MALVATVRGRIDGALRTRNALGFVYAVLKRFGEDRAGQLAALVAYFTFFSLFPLLLVVVTILGIVLEGRPDLQEDIVGSALAQFPIIGAQIRENIGALTGGGLALAAGIAGSLWAGLGGVKAMQTAMDRIWDVPIKAQPAFAPKILRSLGMLAVLGLFVLGAAGLSGIGTQTGDTSAFVRWAGLAGSAILNVGLFVLAYMILTVEKLSWREVLPGALIAGIAWTALQALGGYYVARQLRDASEVYGFFAVVIGLLTWIYLGAQITLLAAEVNVVKRRNLWPRGLTEPLTEADRRALTGYAKVEERRDDETITVSFTPPEEPRRAG